ncbi:macrolide export ATP-binding/permease protein MacB [Oxobacter pfennigii]|uniref:Macrolide export ATP-binding/permease protein MacB n=1 Tax=Oxobacter pfennigii TaxID=36849 RepID=A0A0P8WD23_9CLOT|nr:FtsX-like permease family protein [Oxobacter pfennigii]KPU45668.1 macrolide export ATP-binding/permease protein MacB [Oxobacter pfennigii]
MGIIVKFMLKNIAERKFRTFLILFSIIISSALFFASSAVAGTVEKMFVEQMKNVYGTADIIIQPGDKSPSSFFYMNRLEALTGYMDYAVGTVESIGIYRPNRDEEVRLSLKGINFEDLQIMNPVVLREELKNEPFTGKMIIIGIETAKKYNLKTGDTIDIEIRESKHKFLISGISETIGYFVEQGQNINAVIPRETLSSIYDSKGAVTTVYIKPKDPSMEMNLIDELSKLYKQYVVRETLTQQDIKSSSGGLTSSFMIMVVTLLLMSMFIIYTSFKVITMERLPVIGTFRSIGATKGMTGLMLILEGVFYGIIGGLLGCGLGIGILYLVTYLSSPIWLKGQEITLVYTLSQLVAAFLMAVILSFISSLIPIIRTSSIPVKDIVLNKVEKHSKPAVWLPILGIGLLLISIPVPFIPAKKFGVAIDAIGITAMMAGAVILIPYITGLFIKAFEKVYSYIFGNEGVLAVKNLKDNKNMVNNISLLSIGISTLLMINILSFSVSIEVLNAYGGWQYEIQMWTQNADRDTERIIETIDGVEDVYGESGIYNVNIAGTSEQIVYLQGADAREFPEFYSFTFEGDKKRMLEALDQGRNIITTNIFKDKYNLKEGDTIALKLGGGTKTYRVTGFFDSLMMNGSYALISERYFKLDTGERYLNQIVVKTDKDPDAVAQSIKERFKGMSLWIQTVKESERRNQESNQQLFSVLKGFSFMTMVVGIFGVLNNFLISFMERKRWLAMLRSIGMSRRQIIKMIFVESLTGGLIGGIAGIGSGILLILFVPNSHVIKEVAAPIPMHYSLSIFIYSLLSGMVITLIASIGPAVKSSKLNIIESIKYE